MNKGNRINHPKGPRKQFCPKGHDTFLVGRTASRTCNECQKIATLAWVAEDPTHKRNYDQNWYKINYDRVHIYKRNHQWKKQGILNFYKKPFTVEDYDKMFKEQKGKCAICYIYKSVLSVDHNHTTGIVRGLLCPGCNTKVGLGESKNFKNILKYLGLASIE